VRETYTCTEGLMGWSDFGKSCKPRTCAFMLEILGFYKHVAVDSLFLKPLGHGRGFIGFSVPSRLAEEDEDMSISMIQLLEEVGM
jgi:hypothetical protein